MTRGRVLPKFLPELIRWINRAEVQGEGTLWEVQPWMAPQRRCTKIRQAALLRGKPWGEMEINATVWGRVISFLHGGMGQAQVIFVINWTPGFAVLLLQTLQGIIYVKKIECQ